MKLFIKNNLEYNDVYIHFLDKNKKEISKEVIKDNLDVNLENACFCYFSLNELSSEIIILSKNVSLLVLNKDNDKINVSLSVKDEDDFGKVETYTLKDEKNLFFRDNKEKRIHVLLPKGYDRNKKYGVILMFDAQNIFDKNKVGNYTALNDPYGGWQIEASLSLLKDKYIVIGIENADKYREIELTPSTKMGKFKDILLTINEENLLKGELDYFGDFINETVFPFIEKKYSLDLDEVGIVGSSCGGLASFYLGLRDYLKYKFIFTFTPATGFIEDETLEKFYDKINFVENKDKLPYIFYYQGNKGDLERLLFNVNQNLIPLLVNKEYPKNKIESYIEETAEHNEIMWRYGFNYAINKYIDYKEKKDGR